MELEGRSARSRQQPARQIERAAAARCGVVRGETPVVFSVVEHGF